MKSFFPTWYQEDMINCSGCNRREVNMFGSQGQSIAGAKKRLEERMFFFNDAEGQQRYGTVIASLGLDPNKVTERYLEALKKEFGCTFERGDLLLWVQETEERAEHIFEILRKRHFPIEEKNKPVK